MHVGKSSAASANISKLIRQGPTAPDLPLIACRAMPLTNPVRSLRSLPRGEIR